MSMSSLRGVRRRACTGKMRHPSMRAAIHVAKRYALAYGISREDYGPYKCRFCGGFHTGHTPARVKQAIFAARAARRAA